MSKLVPYITTKPLPYAENALESAISRQTLVYHYYKYKGYVSQLLRMLTMQANKLFANYNLIDIIKNSEGALRNCAQQVYNHEFYFQSLRAEKEFNHPTTQLATVIIKQHGSIGAFQKSIQKLALDLFGSGYVWIGANSEGDIKVIALPNAKNLLDTIWQPLLCIDLWEHAYALDTFKALPLQSDRAAHMDRVMKILNWDFALKNYQDIKINKRK